MFRSAFPDLHQEIEDVVAAGGTVAVRVIMTATHRGSFLGVAPTGRRVWCEGMDFFRFREGKVAEHWTATDDLGLMQQLGVVSSSKPWSRPLPERGFRCIAIWMRQWEPLMPRSGVVHCETGRR